MLDLEKMKAAAESYKKSFPDRWNEEKYKWEAVQHFQKHWHIEADNFGEMFNEATKKHYNLLSSAFYYPAEMIIKFADVEAETVRQMFTDLFDESQDLTARVNAFKNRSKKLLIKYDNGSNDWKDHDQNTNAISTYLWFRYPDKYYIYKYSIYRDTANELSLDYKPKGDGSAESMIGGFEMYDEICAILQQDNEIRQLLEDSLTPECYPDPELKTLTIDFGFYLSNYYIKEQESKREEALWIPHDYDPGFSVDDWATLLQDEAIVTSQSLHVLKSIKDYGGQASCKQLSVKYGGSPQSYNAIATELAQRIAQKTGCPLVKSHEGKYCYWPILFQGKYTEEQDEKVYIWRLRPELSEALDLFDISIIPTKEVSRSYWWLVANPKIWNFSDLKIGEEIYYTLYNENGNKRRIFQNFLDAKAGDYFIGYEGTPVKQIVALGRIPQDNDGEKLSFRKTKDLDYPIDYKTLKEFPELEKMEFLIQPNGSLFKLTEGEYKFIMDIIRQNNPEPINIVMDKSIPKYTKEDFLSVVYMSEARYDLLESLLRHQKNLILQGAPGVGKTFIAKKLAYAMMGKQDDSRIEIIQFHQNYSYEDFIMGYRPVGSDFELCEGIFYRFCRKAANNPDEAYFFIIDEINRGNLSKIFGELLMLIEKDYRGKQVTLAYDGRPFYVPKNIYLIGMMNTADRSLAMIDYALRRRFSFFDIEPAFGSQGFKEYQKGLDNETFDALIKEIQKLNKEIGEDKSLGKGFRIGHSYFCGKDKESCSDKWMRSVIEFEILPMLSEYWFDDDNKLERWEDNLRGVFDD